MTSRIDVIQKVQEVLDNCDDEPPAEGLIKIGECLIGIGKALKGYSIEEAQAIIQAVRAFERIKHQ